MIEVANANTQFTKKKLALCSYPSHILAKTPLNLFPMEVDKNQPPIIKAVKRGGANLDTSDKAIGLKQSSPTVITP